MKVSTITLHSLHNFGSALQAYALYDFLSEQGYDTEIIDYRPSYITHGENRLKTFLGKVLNLPYFIRRNQRFEDFLRQYVRLSDKRFKNIEQLRNEPPKSDVYIAGSDQIWNSTFSCGRDPAYYLDFAKSGRKMSYAASIGKSDVGREEMEWIKGNITDFDFVSVRENSSKSLLEQNGVGDVHWVADPVILRDKENYLKMAVEPAYDSYMLVYHVTPSPLLDYAIDEISIKLGLKVVLLSGFVKKCRCDIFPKDLGPLEFLGLLSKADFVLSSSFHATVFSHIFNKNFGVILPELSSSRIEQLLLQTGLEDRLIRKKEDIKNTFEPINFENSNKILKQFSKDSKKVLVDAIEGR